MRFPTDMHGSTDWCPSPTTLDGRGPRPYLSKGVVQHSDLAFEILNTSG
jgi:hypothetical protein